jgi:O-antigen/teichoic acid export membrane protein
MRAEIKKIFEKGFFHLLGANGLILLAGFASQLFVAKFLDPSDIGAIRIMQTYVGLASTMCALGMNVSIVKLVTQQASDKDKIAYLNVSILVSFIVFLMVWIGLTGANILHFISNEQNIERLFPIYMLFLLPLAIQSVLGGYFQGIDEIRKYAKLQSISKVFSVLLIVATTYLFHLNGYVWAVLLGGLFSIFLLFFSIAKEKRGFDVPLNFKSNFLSLWGLSKFALMTNFVGFLYSSLDIFFINHFKFDLSVFGQYAFAITLISILNVVPQTIQQIAFPHFAGISNQYDKWRKTYLRYNKLNHLVSLFSLVFVYFAIPFMVDFLFNGKYHQSIYYFRGLVIAWTLNYMNNIKDTAVMGLGAFNFNFYISVFLLVISIPLYYVVVSNMGIQGALYVKISLGLFAYLASWISFKLVSKKYFHGAA